MFEQNRKVKTSIAKSCKINLIVVYYLRFYKGKDGAYEENGKKRTTHL